MDTQTLRNARVLWDYLSARRARAPCDVVAVCCSYDLRVCDYACSLIRNGLSQRLLLSGRTGNWTRHIWEEPEAQVFLRRALDLGISESAIMLEELATNFGENVAYARREVPWATAVTFVTKPNSILRVALTVPVQWPGILSWVDSPDVDFPRGVSNVVGILGVIDEMVGDIHRIMEYPKRGFQAPHVVPKDVVHSWRDLIARGFRGHLLPGHDPQNGTVPAPELRRP